MGSMINMDAPRHTRLRQIVNKELLRPGWSTASTRTSGRARNILADVADTGGCDLVEARFQPLPLQIICEMMGIPDQWGRILELTNVVLATRSREWTFRPSWRRDRHRLRIAREVGEDRLAEPATTWCRR